MCNRKASRDIVNVFEQSEVRSTQDAGMSAMRTEDAADGKSTSNGGGLVCQEGGVTVLRYTTH